MVQNRNIVSPTYGAQVAEGNLPGVTPVRKMGHNLAVGATWETIWCKGTLYSYVSTACKVDIYSSDIEDAQNGTGAKTIFIEGLDANYDVISETISTHATDGRTSVTSVNSYLRIFSMRVVTSGSNGTNVGNITMEDAAGLITVQYMCAGDGICSSCLFTVPADKTVTILRWAYNELAAKVSAIAIFVRPFGESWYIEKYKLLKEMTGDSTFTIPIVCAEKTDIEIRAWATAGSGKVSAAVEGYYK